MIASHAETAHTISKKTISRGISQSYTDEEDSKIKRRSQKQSEEELFKQRYNIREILLCSNATPIRKYDLGYVCCFCDNQYPNPEDLKTHTITEHDESDKLDFMKGQRAIYFLVKLDITTLKCTLCDTNIDSDVDLIQHLKNEHGKPMFIDIKNYIIPFKFEDSTLKCTFCPRIFNRFKVLQEHMYTHYRNFVCDVCGTGFVNEKMLNTHSDSHKVGIFKCRHCDEEFDAPRKKKYHEKTVHLLSLNKCGYCDEKFMWYRQKCAHIAEVHGIVVTQPKECKACDKVFPSESKLQLHVRRDHLLERRFKCTECEMDFFTKESLNDHMVKHTGIKMFSCKVCCKSYGLKKALREHMRIHENDRRFKCEKCDKAFVQKGNWKGHMRSKHGITV